MKTIIKEQIELVNTEKEKQKRDAFIKYYGDKTITLNGEIPDNADWEMIDFKFKIDDFSRLPRPTSRIVLGVKFLGGKVGLDEKEECSEEEAHYIIQQWINTQMEKYFGLDHYHVWLL